MSWVADFSDARPDPAALVASGCVGVMRYLGDGALARRYNITRPELDSYHRAGLAVGLVWEREADRMRLGALAGARDAQVADAQADALGYPRDRPIYYANDERDGATAEAVAYMQGVLRVTKRPVGAYGSGKFCAISGAQYRWRVATWPGFNITTHLVQEPNITSPVPGTDYNSIHADDWGGWMPPLSSVQSLPRTGQPTGSDLLAAAQTFTGEPYSTAPGRTSTTSGYKDCSGLIVAAFSLLGITTGGTVSTGLERWAIASGGRYISRDEARVTPGAGLSIWGYGSRGHIGLSVGDGQRAFETPNPQHVVGFSPFGYQRWERYFTWGVLDNDSVIAEEDDMLIVYTKDSKNKDCSLLITGGIKAPVVFRSGADVLAFASQPGQPLRALNMGRTEAIESFGPFSDPPK